MPAADHDAIMLNYSDFATDEPTVSYVDEDRVPRRTAILCKIYRRINKLR